MPQHPLSWVIGRFGTFSKTCFPREAHAARCNGFCHQAAPTRNSGKGFTKGGAKSGCEPQGADGARLLDGTGERERLGLGDVECAACADAGVAAAWHGLAREPWLPSAAMGNSSSLSSSWPQDPAEADIACGSSCGGSLPKLTPNKL